MKKMLMLILVLLPLAGFATDYYFLIPAAAHVAGAFETNWRTDVDAYNPAADTLFFDLILLKAGEDNSNGQVMHQALQPGAAFTFADIVMERFSFEGSGAVLVRSDHPVFPMASRTYNDLTAVGKGTYGQYVPALAQDELLGPNQTGTLLMLRGAPGFRTNLGLASMTAYPITITISMFDSLGQPGGTVKQDLPAFGYVQINDILSQGTALGYTPVIKVTSVTKGALYTAYASVVDNTSGDAIFVPAKK